MDPLTAAGLLIAFGPALRLPPRSELGFAAEPIPADLLPASMRDRAEEQAIIRLPRVTTDSSGRLRIDLLGFLRGVLAPIPGFAPIAAQLPAPIQILPAPTSSGRAIAQPVRESDPFSRWPGLPEATGAGEQIGQPLRLTGGGGVVVSGPTGEQFVTVQTAQGVQTITVEPAIPTQPVAQPTSTDRPEGPTIGGGLGSFRDPWEPPSGGLPA